MHPAQSLLSHRPVAAELAYLRQAINEFRATVDSTRVAIDAGKGVFAEANRILGLSEMGALLPTTAIIRESHLRR